MKKVVSRIILSLVFVCGPVLTNLVMADPPGPPDPGGTPIGNGGVPVGAPIDNGIGILLLFGIAYGVYKLYEIHRKSKKEEVAD